VAIVTLAFVLCINAHAVLVYPTPFNINPTTAAPCGVSAVTDTMKSTAQATWKAGETVTLQWHLVAGDGGGNLNAVFDPLGGTDFTSKTAVPAWTTPFPTSGSGVFYNRTFIVPADLDCSQSPTKLCTMRVYTTSNWNSCTMVKICSTTDNCVPPQAPPKTCTAVTKPLTFCPNITGASLASGFAPSDIDSELAATFTANLAKPTVFATPNNADCQTLYKNFLCASDLPPCNPQTSVADSNGVACKSQCQKAMKACGLTSEHANLYDCNSLPNCNGAASKSGGGMSPGGAAALSIFLIALVATVAIFGYIYYKKGQLFGYAYDKDAHKIVKVASNPHNYTAYVDADYKM